MAIQPTGWFVQTLSHVLAALSCLDARTAAWTSYS